MYTLSSYTCKSQLRMEAGWTTGVRALVRIFTFPTTTKSGLGPVKLPKELLSGVKRRERETRYLSVIYEGLICGRLYHQTSYTPVCLVV